MKKPTYVQFVMQSPAEALKLKAKRTAKQKGLKYNDVLNSYCETMANMNYPNFIRDHGLKFKVLFSDHITSVPVFINGQRLYVYITCNTVFFPNGDFIDMGNSVLSPSNKDASSLPKVTIESVDGFVPVRWKVSIPFTDNHITISVRKDHIGVSVMLDEAKLIVQDMSFSEYDQGIRYVEILETLSGTKIVSKNSGDPTYPTPYEVIKHIAEADYQRCIEIMSGDISLHDKYEGEVSAAKYDKDTHKVTLLGVKTHMENDSIKL